MEKETGQAVEVFPMEQEEVKSESTKKMTVDPDIALQMAEKIREEIRELRKQLREQYDAINAQKQLMVQAKKKILDRGVLREELQRVQSQKRLPTLRRFTVSDVPSAVKEQEQHLLQLWESVQAKMQQTLDNLLMQEEDLKSKLEQKWTLLIDLFEPSVHQHWHIPARFLLLSPEEEEEFKNLQIKRYEQQQLENKLLLQKKEQKKKRKSFGAQSQHFQTSQILEIFLQRRPSKKELQDNNILEHEPANIELGEEWIYILDIEEEEENEQKRMLQELEGFRIVIPYEELQKGEKVGEGSFAEVYKSDYKGKSVAVKTLKSRKYRTFYSFYREASIFTLLKKQSPYIVQFYGCCIDPLCIVTGIARVKDKRGVQHMSPVGNPRWTAPEVIQKQAYSLSADVFSFGMVLYELVANKRPLDEIQNDKDAAAAIAEGKTPYIPDRCCEPVRNIIQKCWAAPKKRPTAARLVRYLQQAMEVLSPSELQEPQNKPPFLSPEEAARFKQEQLMRYEQQLQELEEQIRQRKKKEENDLLLKRLEQIQL